MYFTDDWSCQKLLLSLVEFEFHPSSFLPPTLLSLVLLAVQMSPSRFLLFGSSVPGPMFLSASLSFARFLVHLWLCRRPIYNDTHASFHSRERERERERANLSLCTRGGRKVLDLFSASSFKSDESFLLYFKISLSYYYKLHPSN